MNKATYLKLRALVRANGRSALRWMSEDEAMVMMTLQDAKEADSDYLAERVRTYSAEAKFNATPDFKSVIVLTTPMHLFDHYRKQREFKRSQA